MIIPLNPDNRGHIQAAADFHSRLLGEESPLPQLGERFCRDFYYGTLVRDGLFKCDLAIHEERYIGWISYTLDPLHFMSRGLKHHFGMISRILLVSMIKKPAMIGTILGVIRDMRDREIRADGIDDKPFGEILSFGVLEDSCALTDFKTGEKYPRVLFNRAIEYFRDNDLSGYRLAVRKWYKAALVFYLSYGGRIIDPNYDQDRSYRLEFTIPGVSSDSA